ncbi:hypothetical protein H072_2101 [Dactylellina haptotyla CBS 200.50]|uniref:Uncharacterized protein n=1 Tax=Dactylellina haptotyla (strain CBS 200.50) TaxID=1284197 RepID=S8ALX2_DACHA|nr:hypothetical protein H072_2101 [Dactylellina haptotyla CBS 200.50]
MVFGSKKGSVPPKPDDMDTPLLEPPSPDPTDRMLSLSEIRRLTVPFYRHTSPSFPSRKPDDRPMSSSQKRDTTLPRHRSPRLSEKFHRFPESIKRKIKTAVTGSSSPPELKKTTSIRSPGQRGIKPVIPGILSPEPPAGTSTPEPLSRSTAQQSGWKTAVVKGAGTKTAQRVYEQEEIWQAEGTIASGELVYDKKVKLFEDFMKDKGLPVASAKKKNNFGRYNEDGDGDGNNSDEGYVVISRSKTEADEATREETEDEMDTSEEERERINRPVGPQRSTLQSLGGGSLNLRKQALTSVKKKNKDKMVQWDDLRPVAPTTEPRRRVDRDEFETPAGKLRIMSGLQAMKGTNESIHRSIGWYDSTSFSPLESSGELAEIAARKKAERAEKRGGKKKKVVQEEEEYERILPSSSEEEDGGRKAAKRPNYKEDSGSDYEVEDIPSKKRKVQRTPIRKRKAKTQKNEEEEDQYEEEDPFEEEEQVAKPQGKLAGGIGRKKKKQTKDEGGAAFKPNRDVSNEDEDEDSKPKRGRKVGKTKQKAEIAQEEEAAEDDDGEGEDEPEVEKEEEQVCEEEEGDENGSVTPSEDEENGEERRKEKAVSGLQFYKGANSKALLRSRTPGQESENSDADSHQRESYDKHSMKRKSVERQRRIQGSQLSGLRRLTAAKAFARQNQSKKDGALLEAKTSGFEPAIRGWWGGVKKAASAPPPKIRLPTPMREAREVMKKRAEELQSQKPRYKGLKDTYGKAKKDIFGPSYNEIDDRDDEEVHEANHDDEYDEDTSYEDPSEEYPPEELPPKEYNSGKRLDKISEVNEWGSQDGTHADEASNEPLEVYHPISKAELDEITKDWDGMMQMLQDHREKEGDLAVDLKRSKKKVSSLTAELKEYKEKLGSTQIELAATKAFGHDKLDYLYNVQPPGTHMGAIAKSHNFLDKKDLTKLDVDAIARLPFSGKLKVNPFRHDDMYQRREIINNLSFPGNAMLVDFGTEYLFQCCHCDALTETRVLFFQDEIVWSNCLCYVCFGHYCCARCVRYTKPLDLNDMPQTREGRESLAGGQADKNYEAWVYMKAIWSDYLKQRAMMDTADEIIESPHTVKGLPKSWGKEHAKDFHWEKSSNPATTAAKAGPRAAVPRKRLRDAESDDESDDNGDPPEQPKSKRQMIEEKGEEIAASRCMENRPPIFYEGCTEEEIAEEELEYAKSRASAGPMEFLWDQGSGGW